MMEKKKKMNRCKKTLITISRKNGNIKIENGWLLIQKKSKRLLWGRECELFHTYIHISKTKHSAF